MKLFNYLNKYLNENLNFNISDDINPKNRIIFITIGNTKLKLRIDLKNKKILNGGIDGMIADAKNIKFNQYKKFWEFFGIDTPIDYEDFLSKIKNIVQNNNVNNLIDNLLKQYSEKDNDNKYSQFQIDANFNIKNIK